MPRPTPFATPARFRRWLERHHATARELIVLFHKVGSGKPSMTWPESVDEALCFGWIDGVRRRVDETRYTIRFTPRRPGSIWSAINLRKVKALEAAGRMRPAGRAVHAARDRAKTNRYAFEQKHATLPAAARRAIAANRAAHAYWQAQPPGYRRLITWWIASAKREETQARRVARLIAHSERGERIPAMPAAQAKAPAATPAKRAAAKTARAVRAGRGGAARR